jgi:hypothetical protein
MAEIIEANKGSIYANLEEELRGMESDIKNIYNLSKTLSQFESLVNGHPAVSGIYRNLLDSLDRLKERIDNNMIN